MTQIIHIMEFDSPIFSITDQNDVVQSFLINMYKAINIAVVIELLNALIVLTKNRFFESGYVILDILEVHTILFVDTGLSCRDTQRYLDQHRHLEFYYTVHEFQLM